MHYWLRIKYEGGQLDWYLDENKYLGFLSMIQAGVLNPQSWTAFPALEPVYDLHTTSLHHTCRGCNITLGPGLMTAVFWPQPPWDVRGQEPYRLMFWECLSCSRVRDEQAWGEALVVIA